tara:strand:+ start:127 stop:537 length:411 start_codon:yes stop_codon:yes gene_type:complete
MNSQEFTHEDLTRYLNLKTVKEDIDSQLQLLEYRAIKWMESNNAAKIFGDDANLKKVVSRTSYDINKLLPLLETKHGDYLVDIGAIIPGHEETRQVPPKAYGPRLNKAKREMGGKAAETIEEATQRTYKIEIEEKD